MCSGEGTVEAIGDVATFKKTVTTTLHLVIQHTHLLCTNSSIIASYVASYFGYL